MEIVWVELGRRAPGYLFNNIQLNSAMFPELKRTIVSDREMSKLRIKKADNYVISSQESDLYNGIRELQRNSPDKNSDFWINTTTRFFGLLKYMEHSGAKNVVHLESDCVLLQSGDLEHRFESAQWNLAYPMQSRGIGCASIMLIRDVEAISDFCQFIIKELSSQNFFSDDMTLLGRYAEISSRTQILASSFNSQNEFVYDAQSFGKYFLGTDARNLRLPFSSRGIDDLRPESGTIQFSSKERFKVRKLGQKQIDVQCVKSESRLVNVHVHSKRIPRTVSKLVWNLNRGTSKRHSLTWRLGHIDYLVFLERLVSRFRKKVLGLKFSNEIRLR